MNKNGLVLAALALCTTLVHAEDYLSPTEERVRLSLGVVHLSNDTDLQLDSSTGVPGTAVNAEDAFGLDKSDYEAKIQAMVRVGERHRLRFDYFSLDRSGFRPRLPNPSSSAMSCCSPAIREFGPVDPHLRHHLWLFVSA